ncbi:glycosyltransferase family 4 protein [Novosphingobium sp. JCM 18896]|uniref:glycosyltransferase family 4 protein n=1 Tax=Novosphingobium sp. JCM 18896 TaxID=2989731 RepID=UPI002221F7F2|nr:glycosyltransferase family 4 protein [Novosphingobium sp. JCM 18896]MCW1432504.1 glycosyltransferase family 4 protein [Novosphingobium sp. JCM 18896]
MALIGTFAPRKCGIATFTEDLKTKVEAHHPNINFDVYALDHLERSSLYDPCVRILAVDEPGAYSDTARAINASGAEAVWLQHEYGIFGGPDGELVTELTDGLSVPLIVTFHTILSEPSARQRDVLARLLARTSHAMVMSRHGRDLLVKLYGAAPDRVTVIEHGAPDRPFGRENQFKLRLGLPKRPVLTTFGLLGPGKGLEHAIEALPAITARHPRVLYRIVGATHPNLVSEQGEAYRDQLKARVVALGVEANVAWDDRFLDTPELLDQLEACDIYLTPYHNLQQSTSGTLSYAVALGKAVVSTPYIHARELLANGVGRLVPVGDPVAIAAAVNALLDHPLELARLKAAAYARGRATIWPRFAQASADLIARASETISSTLPEAGITRSAFDFEGRTTQRATGSHFMSRPSSVTIPAEVRATG